MVKNNTNISEEYIWEQLGSIMDPEIPKISSPDLIDDSAKCIMEWHQVSPEKAEDFLIDLIKNHAVNLDTFS